MYVFMYVSVGRHTPSPSTDHGGVAPEGLSELHRHVAQASQPDDPELMVWSQPELIHGRVRRRGAEWRPPGRGWRGS